MLTYKIVCVKCGNEYVPLKNGIYVCEVADFGPYKIWQADLIYCKICKDAVISGFGQQSVDHHNDNFTYHLGYVELFFGYNDESREKAKELQADVGELDINKIIEEMESIGG